MGARRSSTENASENSMVCKCVGMWHSHVYIGVLHSRDLLLLFDHVIWMRFNIQGQAKKTSLSDDRIYCYEGASWSVRGRSLCCCLSAAVFLLLSLAMIALLSQRACHLATTRTLMF